MSRGSAGGCRVGMSLLVMVGAKCGFILLPWGGCGIDREVGFPATGRCSGEHKRIKRVLRHIQGGVC